MQDDIKKCFTFKEEENHIQIYMRNNQNQKTLSSILNQFSDFDFLIHRDSLVFIDKNVKIIYYINNEPPLKTMELNNQDLRFQYLFSDNLIPLISFGSYLGYATTDNSQSDILLFYGSKGNLLQFLLLDIKKNDQNQLKTINIEREIKSIQNNLQPELIKMSDDLNFLLCLYKNGTFTLIKGKSQYSHKSLIRNETWVQTKLFINSMEMFYFNYNGFINLLFNDRNGIYYLENMNVEEKIKISKQNCILSGSVSFVIADFTQRDIFYIESKEGKDYLCRLNMNSKKVECQIKLQGIVQNMKRDKRHAYISLKQSSRRDSNIKQNIFQIYDVINFYHTFTFQKNNLQIYSQQIYNDGCLLIIGQNDQKNKQIQDIKQLSDQRKFEIFRERKIFDLAGRFAENNNEMYLKFQILKLAGDYYFKEGQYDQAIQNYIGTIKALELKNINKQEFESSFMIKKFLTTTLLPYMIMYLEALHSSQQNLATIHDTTLLVNSYLKQDNTEDLKKWFQNYQFLNEEIIQKTIESCLEFNKIQLAKELAQKSNKFHIYLSISIQNCFYGNLEKNQIQEEVNGILKFLQKIPVEDVKKSLKDHGHLIYPYNSSETWKLIEQILLTDSKNLSDFSVLSFINIFDDLEEMTIFKETDLFVQFCNKKLNQLSEGKTETATFVINYYYFQMMKGIDKIGYKQKIKEFLNNDIMRLIDPTYLLNLFEGDEFYQEKKIIMENTTKRTDLVELCFGNKDYEECINICCGNQLDFDLPIFLLKKICIAQDNSSELIPQVLNLINTQGYHDKLQIIKILKTHKTLKLNDIRSSFNKLFLTKKNKIEEIDSEIKEKQRKIDEKVEQIIQLKTKPTLLQFTVCQFCKMKINNPVTYFFCGHFYHSNCLESKNCQECDLEQKEILERRQSLLNQKISENSVNPLNFENAVELLGKSKFQFNYNVNIYFSQ